MKSSPVLGKGGKSLQPPLYDQIFDLFNTGKLSFQIEKKSKEGVPVRVFLDRSTRRHYAVVGKTGHDFGTNLQKLKTFLIDQGLDQVAANYVQPASILPAPTRKRKISDYL